MLTVQRGGRKRRLVFVLRFEWTLRGFLNAAAAGHASCKRRACGLKRGARAPAESSAQDSKAAPIVARAAPRNTRETAALTARTHPAGRAGSATLSARAPLALSTRGARQPSAPATRAPRVDCHARAPQLANAAGQDAGKRRAKVSPEESRRVWNRRPDRACGSSEPADERRRHANGDFPGSRNTPRRVRKSSAEVTARRRGPLTGGVRG